MSDNLIYTPSNITIETMRQNSQPSTMITAKPNTKLQSAVLSEMAVKFSSTLNAGQALVKHIGSNEVKRIEVKPNIMNGKSIQAQAYNLRDTRVTPKKNYTGIDETIVNIFSHKGPDEPEGGIGGFDEGGFDIGGLI